MGRRKQNAPKRASDGDIVQGMHSASILDDKATSSSTPSLFPSSDTSPAPLYQWSADMARLMSPANPNPNPHKPDLSLVLFYLNRFPALSASQPLDLSRSSLTPSLLAGPTSPTAGPSMSETLRRMSMVAAVVSHQQQRSDWAASAQSAWSLPPPPPKVMDTTADVFRCLWCQDRFGSLAALTQHIREAKHTGESKSEPIPFDSRPPPPPSFKSLSPAPPMASLLPPTTSSSSSLSASSASLQPPPRKLVRGQDVWLGKGAEQTRQILKCMWCGESFASLSDMTVHMRQTEHYTKVISHEQISSWRTADKTDAAHKTERTEKIAAKENKAKDPFKLKDGYLSESKSATAKRKKTLPVKKLLELERQHDVKEDHRLEVDAAGGGPNGPKSILGSLEHMVANSFGAVGMTRRGDNSGLLQRFSVNDAPEPKQSAGVGPLEALREMCAVPDEDVGAASRSSSTASSEAGSEAEAEAHVSDNNRGVKRASLSSTASSVSVSAGGSKRSSVDNMLFAADMCSEARFLKYSQLAKQLSGR